jgi:hypothetical protein
MTIQLRLTRLIRCDEISQVMPGTLDTFMFSAYKFREIQEGTKQQLLHLYKSMINGIFDNHAVTKISAMLRSQILLSGLNLTFIIDVWPGNCACLNTIAWLISNPGIFHKAKDSNVMGDHITLNS